MSIRKRKNQEAVLRAVESLATLYNEGMLLLETDPERIVWEAIDEIKALRARGPVTPSCGGK